MMAERTFTDRLKTELKSLVRGALAAREVEYMWTHLLPTGRPLFYDRWTAVRQEEDCRRWDVYHQEFRTAPRAISPVTDPLKIAEGVSVADAMRILKEKEENHPRFSELVGAERKKPTSHHYSRAGVAVVEDLAQRTSAARVARMRRGRRPK